MALNDYNLELKGITTQMIIIMPYTDKRIHFLKLQGYREIAIDDKVFVRKVCEMLRYTTVAKRYIYFYE